LQQISFERLVGRHDSNRGFLFGRIFGAPRQKPGYQGNRRLPGLRYRSGLLELPLRVSPAAAASRPSYPSRGSVFGTFFFKAGRALLQDYQIAEKQGFYAS
jgi:hypothetical protein